MSSAAILIGMLGLLLVSVAHANTATYLRKAISKASDEGRRHVNR